MNQSKAQSQHNGSNGGFDSLATTLVQQRQKCQCELTSQYTCSKSSQILALNYKSKDFENLKQDYLNLLSYTIDETQSRQIQKDIDRTHPLVKFFQKDGEGPQQLERILQCIAKYDPTIGYVQGMNYLVGGLLYHAEEYVAFWNFVVAYETLELRDIYLPNLPGLSKHIQITELLLMSSEPILYKHMINNQVVFALFCTPLFFSLFGLVVPIEEYVEFYYKLITKNWNFAYKIILSYIKHSKDHLLSIEGPELLMFLTQANHQIQGSEKSQQYFIVWSDVIKKADEIVIDDKFVKKMLSNFDLEKQRFIPQNIK